MIFFESWRTAPSKTGIEPTKLRSDPRTRVVEISSATYDFRGSLQNRVRPDADYVPAILQRYKRFWCLPGYQGFDSVIGVNSVGNSLIVSEGWGRHPTDLASGPVGRVLMPCILPRNSHWTGAWTSHTQTFHCVSRQGFDYTDFLPIAAQQEVIPVQQCRNPLSPCEFRSKTADRGHDISVLRLVRQGVKILKGVFAHLLESMSPGTEVCFPPMLPPHQCNTITYINNHTNIE